MEIFCILFARLTELLYDYLTYRRSKVARTIKDRTMRFALYFLVDGKRPKYGSRIVYFAPSYHRVNWCLIGWCLIGWCLIGCFDKTVIKV